MKNLGITCLESHGPVFPAPRRYGCTFKYEEQHLLHYRGAVTAGPSVCGPRHGCATSSQKAPDSSGGHTEILQDPLWHGGPIRVSVRVQVTSGASQALEDLPTSSLYKVDHGCWLVWLLS